MSTSDFTSTILVDQSPEQAFKAILNVRGWWSEDIEGSTDKLNEEFEYHYEDVHYCKMKLIELVPNKKAVWLVLDNLFNFTKDKSEWKGTKISFEISEKNNKTQIRFTHIGLVPAYECYDICQNAWTNYIQESLRDFIMTGKGQPNPKGGRNAYQDALSRKMNAQGYKSGIIVDATPEQAFKAINNVRGWWSEDMEGALQKAGDVFTVRFGEIYITMKVEESIPGKKIVWNVIDCNKPWLKNTKEWNGTQLVWEIFEKHNKTQIQFTHVGLVPEVECFDVCSNAWVEYIQGSLLNLINTGKGKPTRKQATAKAN